jgi:hypothetical protein
MKKSEANAEFSRSYRLFQDYLSKILNFKLDLPDTLEYLKLEKTLTIKTHILEGNLNKQQIKANEIYLDNSLKNIDKYPDIIYSMAFIYIVAAFEVFLKNSIKTLIKFDEYAFRESDKKLSYSEVFAFNSYNELIDFIAEKTVYELGYKSISEQIKFLNEKIHINLSFKEGKGLIANRRYIDLDLTNEIFSTRNILLHNGGIINKKYLDINPTSVFKEGEERKLTREYLIEVWAAIRHSGEAIYRQSEIFIKNKKDERKTTKDT